MAIDAKDQAKADRLRKKAAADMARAEKQLKRSDVGEMERQIAQAQHMELSFNYMQQAAIVEGDNALLKNSAEQASRWAGHMRQATSKRKNDLLPLLIAALTGGASWSEAAKTLKEREVE